MLSTMSSVITIINNNYYHNEKIVLYKLKNIRFIMVT